MAWVLLVLGTLCVVECFIRLPLLGSSRQLLGLLGKITSVLRSSSISDHWKEKVLPVYAGKLFANSVVVFAWVVLGLMPMVVVVAVADGAAVVVDAVPAVGVGVGVGDGVGCVVVVAAADFCF